MNENLTLSLPNWPGNESYRWLVEKRHFKDLPPYHPEMGPNRKLYKKELQGH